MLKCYKDNIELKSDKRTTLEQLIDIIYNTEGDFKVVKEGIKTNYSYQTRRGKYDFIAKVEGKIKRIHAFVEDFAVWILNYPSIGKVTFKVKKVEHKKVECEVVK
jgi:hypothetical protein